jgi:hypothetical protein
MSKIKTGGPAFPSISDITFKPNWATEEGMTLRDYYVGKALQGLMANPNVVGFNASCGWRRKKDIDYGGTWFWISPEGKGKPTTEITYGYLMSTKGQKEK